MKNQEWMVGKPAEEIAKALSEDTSLEILLFDVLQILTHKKINPEQEMKDAKNLEAEVKNNTKRVFLNWLTCEHKEKTASADTPTAN